MQSYFELREKKEVVPASLRLLDLNDNLDPSSQQESVVDAEAQKCFFKIFAEAVARQFGQASFGFAFRLDKGGILPK